MSVTESEEPRRRSAGALAVGRRALAWPKNREFRILSIDGGGIRGIFPASILAGIEERYLGGASVAQYFDLIAGTSTGGILALGLGSGLTAGDVRDLYINRGCEVFPPWGDGAWSRIERRIGNFVQWFKYRYSRDALSQLVKDTFGELRFGESRVRMCIPAADGAYGEPYIFKTPHHPDFRLDAAEYMTKVALATSAAPTFFQPWEDSGYVFLDGGLWANDPTMVALVDALTCFDLPRHCVRILSIGCGSSAWVVDRAKLRGGLLAWRRVIEAAMHLQSHNVRGQAGLLIGRDRLVRVDAPTDGNEIGLDDYRCAVQELVPAAESIVDRAGESLVEAYFSEKTLVYHPIRDR